MKKNIIIGIALLLVIGGGLWYYLTRPTLEDTIAFPYISHQKPAVDPHLPSSNAIADKLDEVLFDGLFNLTATSSGVVFENGLGEFVSIDDNIVTIRLKTGHYWHDGYRTFVDGSKVRVEKTGVHEFSSRDLAFTLKRIQSLGSLSPDYILVGQALPVMDFQGPNERNEIKLKFRPDRIWIESDIKEVLSFKILPDNAEMNLRSFSMAMTLPARSASNPVRTPLPGPISSTTSSLVRDANSTTLFATEVSTSKCCPIDLVLRVVMFFGCECPSGSILVSIYCVKDF